MRMQFTAAAVVLLVAVAIPASADWRMVMLEPSEDSPRRFGIESESTAGDRGVLMIACDGSGDMVVALVLDDPVAEPGDALEINLHLDQEQPITTRWVAASPTGRTLVWTREPKLFPVALILGDIQTLIVSTGENLEARFDVAGLKESVPGLPCWSVE